MHRKPLPRDPTAALPACLAGPPLFLCLDLGLPAHRPGTEAFSRVAPNLGLRSPAVASRTTGRTKVVRGIVLSLVLGLVQACAGDPGLPAPPGTVVPAADSGYRLVYGESEKEVRRLSAAETAVPWAPGHTATRLVSSLLTVREGFPLPEEFLERWPGELTVYLEEYGRFDGERPVDYGWVWMNFSGHDREESSNSFAEPPGPLRAGRLVDGDCEALSVKFPEPLVWGSRGKSGAQVIVPAVVMKRNTLGLFNPRGGLRGRPELEGDLEARLVLEDVLETPASLNLDYELSLTGQGVMRSFLPGGAEWLASDPGALDQDREEPCRIEILRAGTRQYTRDPAAGGWVLERDDFRETWHAEGLETGQTVHESGLGGPNCDGSLRPARLPQRRQRLGARVDVRDFGAAGDGTTLDTGAINAAIAACADGGGGTVVFPPGVFLSGSIHLRSGVALKLEAGAVLRGTRVMRNYDPREDSPWSEYQDASQTYFRHSLIWGENLENIAVLGPGSIDGHDAFDPWPGMEESPPPPYGWILSTILYQIDDRVFPRGAKPIALKLCRNVLLKDFTIRHAPDEAILAAGCENVLVQGYRTEEVRVDGIDPVCCRRLTITDAEIRSLDDAVALKSSYTLGYRCSSEEVLVKNSLLSTFINALKIGTESVGDFRNIVFRDCRVRNLAGLPSFAGISLMSVDGGTLENILYADITLENTGYPIFIRLGDRLRSPEGPEVGSVRNVTIRNLIASGGLGAGASSVTAVPGSRAGGGLRLENLDLACRGGGHLLSSYAPVPEIRESEGVYPDPAYILPGDSPAYGFYCRHVRGLEFRGLRLSFEKADRRAALICEDVEGLVLEDLDARRIPGAAPSVIVR